MEAPALAKGKIALSLSWRTNQRQACGLLMVLFVANVARFTSLCRMEQITAAAAVYYNRSDVQNVHLLFLMPYEYLTMGVKSQEKK